MELGLRAMAAAGAESVMTLDACRQMEFRPQRNAAGKLTNVKELEAYLANMHAEGALAADAASTGPSCPLLACKGS